jgi:hypothetical protein
MYVRMLYVGRLCVCRHRHIRRLCAHTEGLQQRRVFGLFVRVRVFAHSCSNDVPRGGRGRDGLCVVIVVVVVVGVMVCLLSTVCALCRRVCE